MGGYYPCIAPTREDLWSEAEEWSYQRAREEGDVDLDYDDDLIASWQEKHYTWLCEQEGVKEMWRYEDRPRGG